MEAVIRSAIMAIARGGAAEAIATSTTRLTTAALCTIAAAVLVMASIGCGSAALWIWAIPRLGPAGAPLAVAGVFLVACGAALALTRHALRHRPTPSPSNAVPALLLDEATQLLKDHKCTVLMAAVIAGLAAGRNQR